MNTREWIDEIEDLLSDYPLLFYGSEDGSITIILNMPIGEAEGVYCYPVLIHAECPEQAYHKAVKIIEGTSEYEEI